jgi:hypothetical protein
MPAKMLGGQRNCKGTAEPINAQFVPSCLDPRCLVSSAKRGRAFAVPVRSGIATKKVVAWSFVLRAAG